MSLGGRGRARAPLHTEHQGVSEEARLLQHPTVLLPRASPLHEVVLPPPPPTSPSEDGASSTLSRTPAPTSPRQSCLSRKLLYLQTHRWYRPQRPCAHFRLTCAPPSVPSSGHPGASWEPKHFLNLSITCMYIKSLFGQRSMPCVSLACPGEKILKHVWRKGSQGKTPSSWVPSFFSCGRVLLCNQAGFKLTAIPLPQHRES